MMKSKLMEVLEIQSVSFNQKEMFKYIEGQLKAIGCDYYVDDGNIYATKGNANLYPCIASHMDTVHDIVSNLTAVEINGNITGFNAKTMQQTGIGGDDKVGIFIALQCLEKFDNIKAVFFRDEEVGCAGSYDCDFTFFNDCYFVLQCDRKGNGDFITNASGVTLSSKGFQHEIRKVMGKYKYNFNTGMMTDVMALKECGVLCSMANISCGYYNPHCKDEYVNIKDVSNCLDMVTDIIESLPVKQYDCKYSIPPVKKYKGVAAKSNKIDWDYLNNKYLDQSEDFYEDVKFEEHCDCCDEKAMLKHISEYNMDMCDKCIKAYVHLSDRQEAN